MRRPARPAPPPQTEIARRLEEVRGKAGILSLRAFWEKLKEGWGKEEGLVSYEAVRNYHYDRDPPVSYLSRVSKVFEYRLAWLAAGDGLPTVEEEERAVVERRRREDPLSAAALEGLRETMPLASHLTYEWRHLTGVAIKLADSLRLYGGGAESAEEYHRAAGRLLGRCIGGPLEMLRVKIDDVRLAQAFVMASAFAIEIVAHRATLRIDDTNDDTTEETDDV